MPGRIWRSVWAGVWAILKEIGDENAYARYLAARGVADSGEEWRLFSDRRFREKYARAKCC
jgi:hypothetical protein